MKLRRVRPQELCCQFLLFYLVLGSIDIINAQVIDGQAAAVVYD